MPGPASGGGFRFDLLRCQSTSGGRAGGLALEREVVDAVAVHVDVGHLPPAAAVPRDSDRVDLVRSGTLGTRFRREGDLLAALEAIELARRIEFSPRCKKHSFPSSAA